MASGKKGVLMLDQCRWAQSHRAQSLQEEIMPSLGVSATAKWWCFFWVAGGTWNESRGDRVGGETEVEGGGISKTFFHCILNSMLNQKYFKSARVK